MLDIDDSSDLEFALMFGEARISHHQKLHLNLELEERKKLESLLTMFCLLAGSHYKYFTLVAYYQLYFWT